MAKTNITTEKLLPWDDYKGKLPDQSLSLIYNQMNKLSLEMCTWYWESIKDKKVMSLTTRAFAFIFLIVGTILPILSALNETANHRLLFTQWGVALLVTAGLFTVADRVFGWSGGWMRYISTVTTMENLTRAYELEWASYIASKSSPLDGSDVKVLFDLSVTLEKELTNSCYADAACCLRA